MVSTLSFLRKVGTIACAFAIAGSSRAAQLPSSLAKMGKPTNVTPSRQISNFFFSHQRPGLSSLSRLPTS
jgi:hypothetical protein